MHTHNFLYHQGMHLVTERKKLQEFNFPYQQKPFDTYHVKSNNIYHPHHQGMLKRLKSTTTFVHIPSDVLWKYVHVAQLMGHRV